MCIVLVFIWYIKESLYIYYDSYIDFQNVDLYVAFVSFEVVSIWHNFKMIFAWAKDNFTLTIPLDVFRGKRYPLCNSSPKAEVMPHWPPASTLLLFTRIYMTNRQSLCKLILNSMIYFMKEILRFLTDKILKSFYEICFTFNPVSQSCTPS